MRVTIKRGIIALGVGLALTACADLTGDKLTDNPNRPTVASVATLFGAAQPNLYVYLEGHGVRSVCVWMQQCAGTDKQYLGIGTYAQSFNEWVTVWSQTYGKGGLIDLRTLQQLALASGDSASAGVGAILEAWLVGSTADLFGDIPYREASKANLAPIFDPQQQVYADLQQKLDDAIQDLNSTSPLSTGPRDVDLVYNGNKVKWRRLAYTLKARLFLHTAEVVGATAYANALASALQGINLPANEYNAYHALSQSENNLWYQFTGAWVGYLSAGEALVDTLFSRGDPRIADYFNQNGAGDYRGALPGEAIADTMSTLSDARLAPDFRQPLVTWAENQLIIAEAAYQTGDEPTAQAALVAVRTNAGVPSPDYGGAPPTGPALLSEIMLEKYIATFQTLETWNDYKRTCLPALAPASGSFEIPGRFIYPQNERANNPNTPADPARNWNDPNGC